jgi:hypothetical protein
MGLSIGSLVRPTFSNEAVYLFPHNPVDNTRFGNTLDYQGSLWRRNSTGIVLEVLSGLDGFGWVRIAVPCGTGWIGEWNITLVD